MAKLPIIQPIAERAFGDSHRTGIRSLERTNVLTTLAVVAIPGIALILRMWGIRFGLPYEYHIDEVQYVRHAAAMGQRGFEPTWWNNPPFYKYLFFAEYGVLYVVGRALGWYGSLQEFAAILRADPSALYVLGRGTSALLGTGTVVLTYLAASVTYRKATALAAAWFLSTAFLHARDSHFAVNDVAVTFFMTLALFASLNMLTSNRLRWYILAGIALGFGFATKYSAVFAAIPVLTSYALSRNLRSSRSLLERILPLFLTSGIAVISAVAASPYFALSPIDVAKDIYEALILAGRNGFDGWQIDAANGPIFYFRTLVWGLGWPLFLLALAGIIFALWRRQKADLILAIYSILFYLIAARQEMYFARFMIPILPPIVILAAEVLRSSTATRVQGRSYTIGFASLVLAFSAISLVSTLRFNYLLTQTDTRTLATEWIEENLAPGSKIAIDLEFLGPALHTLYDETTARQIYEVEFFLHHGLAQHPPEWYQDQDFDYLIVSSFVSDLKMLSPTRTEERERFYQSLPKTFEPVANFSPFADTTDSTRFIWDEIYGPAVTLWQRIRPGPELTVYRVEG